MSTALEKIKQQLEALVKHQLAQVSEDEVKGDWAIAAAKLEYALYSINSFQSFLKVWVEQGLEGASPNKTDGIVMGDLDRIMVGLTGPTQLVSTNLANLDIPNQGRALLDCVDKVVADADIDNKLGFFRAQAAGSACATLLLTSPDLTLAAFQQAAANIATSSHLDTYRHQGSSLLHLAVGAKKGEIALWLMQQSMALTTQLDAQGLYPFGLPEVHLLPSDVVRQLLYLTNHHGGDDLDFTRAEPQFAALCAAAIRDRKPQILVLCITFAYKQFGKALSNLKIQGVPAITWLCQRPEYFEMLQCFTDSANLRFFQFYDACLYEGESGVEQLLLSTYKGTQHRYVTPLESAALHGNHKAIEHLTTLIHPKSSDHIDVRMSKQFQPDSERCTLVFNFLVNRLWQSLTTEGSLSPLSDNLAQDWEMIRSLRHKLPHLVPKWLLENNSYRALTYVTDSAKQNPVFPLRELFQLTLCVYVLRVGHDKKRADGITRANEFMAEFRWEKPRDNYEEIWLQLSNLLAEPQHSSDENSYRNLLIRFILLEHPQHREYFGLNRADFPTEGKPWWNNPAIALAMATIIRMTINAPRDYPEPHKRLMNAIITCVKTATRAYFFDHCRQKDAELKGFKAAADLWVALGSLVDPKDLLVKLHNFLVFGWSFGEDSFRGNVQAALLADKSIADSVALDGKNPTHTHLVNCLKDYGVRCWPESESEFTRANLGRVFGFFNNLVEKSPASQASPQLGAPI